MLTKPQMSPTTNDAVDQGCLRVLVADDDTDATNSLCQLARCWGHDAWGVFDGDAALELALAYLPEVLLLDLAMPGLSGYDVARRLRERRRFDDALLVAVTGYTDQRHRLMGVLAGFDHFLVKPVKPTVIERLLGGERDRLAASRRRAPTARVDRVGANLRG